MKNSVKASLLFYVDGKKLEPQVYIDLDMYFEVDQGLDFIYDQMGKKGWLEQV